MFRRLFSSRAATPEPAPALTGNCPIREHTGDGHYVGPCEFACYENVCPRHGRLADYPTNDDREVAVADRDFAGLEEFLRTRR